MSPLENVSKSLTFTLGEDFSVAMILYFQELQLTKLFLVLNYSRLKSEYKPIGFKPIVVYFLLM